MTGRPVTPGLTAAVGRLAERVSKLERRKPFYPDWAIGYRGNSDPFAVTSGAGAYGFPLTHIYATTFEHFGNHLDAHDPDRATPTDCIYLYTPGVYLFQALGRWQEGAFVKSLAVGDVSGGPDFGSEDFYAPAGGIFNPTGDSAGQDIYEAAGYTGGLDAVGEGALRLFGNVEDIGVHAAGIKLHQTSGSAKDFNGTLLVMRIGDVRRGIVDEYYKPLEYTGPTYSTWIA